MLAAGGFALIPGWVSSRSVHEIRRIPPRYGSKTLASHEIHMGADHAWRIMARRIVRSQRGQGPPSRRVGKDRSVAPGCRWYHRRSKDRRSARMEPARAWSAPSGTVRRAACRTAASRRSIRRGCRLCCRRSGNRSCSGIRRTSCFDRRMGATSCGRRRLPLFAAPVLAPSDQDRRR